MYKAYIEPDLKAAHLQIHNKFNPFSGFMNPTYILKSPKRIPADEIKKVLKVWQWEKSFLGSTYLEAASSQKHLKFVAHAAAAAAAAAADFESCICCSFACFDCNCITARPDCQATPCTGGQHMILARLQFGMHVHPISLHGHHHTKDSSFGW